MNFWVDHISNQEPLKQIKSQLCNLKHFVIQKLKILDFHFNCLWGVLTNRPSIWRNFTCWILKIIDIPSMKQNNAKFGRFVGFSKIRRHHWKLPDFSQGKWDISIVFWGCCEIMDIPLRKRIFENPKYVKSRQNRVISVEILTPKSQ